MGEARQPSSHHTFRPVFKAVAGVLLGIATLFLAARGVRMQDLRDVLQSVALPGLVAALLSSLLTPIIKAIRWRWLFYPSRPALSLGRLASLVVIGQAVNILIPGRWGELVRTYMTGQEGQLSKSFTLGTLAAEKLIDLIVLAVLLLALIPFVALPEWLARRAGPILATSLVVALITILALSKRGTWMRLIELVLARMPIGLASRWRTRAIAGLDGLSALSNRRVAIAIWGWTILFWFMSALTNLLLLTAFGLPPSLLVALFLLVVLQGGVAVPSTPGKLGVFQYLCVLALGVFGASQSIALSYGIVLYALVVGGISVWTAIALWRDSVSIGELARATRAWQ